MASSPSLIIVPGWRDSGPGHWQTHWGPVRLSGAYARAWGSEFVRLQQAGHINVESGHGEWPLGLALLQSLGAAMPAIPSPSNNILETP